MSNGITGHYMSGKRSFVIPARLNQEGKEIIVFDQDQNQLARANLHEIIISDRLGNIPRKVTFPDSSHFETKENELFSSKNELQKIFKKIELSIPALSNSPEITQINFTLKYRVGKLIPAIVASY